MHKPVWILPLLLIACGNDPAERPPGATPTMSLARHCEVAREQAKQGDCLSAGEHLAFCSGPDAATARAEAVRLCSPGAPRASTSPDGSTEVPPVITGSAEPTAEPPAEPSATSSAATSDGTRACNEAISHALSRRCAAARAVLKRCVGPKRSTAQAHVNANCRQDRPEVEGPFGY
ncbi:MAG: hypothetical protein JRI68_19505 [Deltaproteobacteria bacterium]|nr:hypothetical protein [Deltaproteobacteria bacterium]